MLVEHINACSALLIYKRPAYQGLVGYVIDTCGLLGDTKRAPAIFRPPIFRSTHTTHTGLSFFGIFGRLLKGTQQELNHCGVSLPGPPACWSCQKTRPLVNRYEWQVLTSSEELTRPLEIMYRASASRRDRATKGTGAPTHVGFAAPENSFATALSINSWSSFVCG